MIRSSLVAILSGALIWTLASSVSVPAMAASRPSAHISPQKVAIGGPATLVASHLTANRFFTLLLAVPDTKKPRAEAFIQLARSDRHGSVNVRFRMPIVTLCGRGAVYVYAARTPVTLHIPVTLTGCTPKAGQTIPPPPAKP